MQVICIYKYVFGQNVWGGAYQEYKESLMSKPV